MVQMVRFNSNKLDKPLRDTILNLYRPFKRTPCFLHSFLEGFIRKTRKLSLIIEFEKGCHETGYHEVQQVLNKHFLNGIRKNFFRVSSCSADVTPDGLQEILSSCKNIRRVYLNREVRAVLDAAVPSANAKNIVRNGIALTGKGVKIAIIDTGIHPHQDLAGRITDFADFINNRTEPYDDNGHGTHCAGDACGNGSASSSKYAGPAPEASLVGVKVLDKIGSGSLETVMEGVDWCMQYNQDHPNDKIDIISMSLGSTAQPFSKENDDPMVQIVEEAWNSGITVCAAAGNEGPDAQTIASPGISNLVITVGALDDRNTSENKEDDEAAGFSSRGPTIYGETKPDILAPGVNIVSLRSPGSYLDKIQKSARVDNDYFMLSGTSMATPICAGIAALIKQDNPNLTPQDIKDLLKSGAVEWSGRDPNTYGAGYINAENSIPFK